MRTVETILVPSEEKDLFLLCPPFSFCEAVVVFPCLCQAASNSFPAWIFSSMMHTQAAFSAGGGRRGGLALQNIHGWTPGLAPDLLIQGWGHPSALLIISLLNGCP